MLKSLLLGVFLMFITSLSTPRHQQTTSVKFHKVLLGSNQSNVDLGIANNTLFQEI